MVAATDKGQAPQRVALVTGGTRGIGRAIAEALQAGGHRVVVTYAGNDEAAKACADETGLHTVKFDVADFEACAAGVREAEAAVGAPVDILVNNAGITRDAPFHKMDLAAWQLVIDTDLTSAFNMTRQVWDGMRERGWGRVVNISSINGQKGQFGQANYSAAKAGLIGLTRALAQEGARKGITANAVAPGYIDTDMVASVPEKVLDGIIAGIPVGRLGSAREIGAAVAFLAGEEAGFVTGSVLTANGGQYIAA